MGWGGGCLDSCAGRGSGDGQKGLPGGGRKGGSGAGGVSLPINPRVKAEGSKIADAATPLLAAAGKGGCAGEGGSLASTCSCPALQREGRGAPEHQPQQDSSGSRDCLAKFPIASKLVQHPDLCTPSLGPGKFTTSLGCFET